MGRNFDGIAAYGQASLTLSAYQTISVAFWAINTANSSFDQLFCEYGPNTNTTKGFYIDPNYSGHPGNSGFFLTGNNSGSGTQGYFTQPSANVWHHYVYLFDMSVNLGSNAQWVPAVYVDGVSQSLLYDSAGGATPSASFNNQTLNFMCRNAASLFNAGKMADFAIWGGVLLSSAQALALSSGARPNTVQSANLVNWWPLGSGATPFFGGIDPDLSGTANITFVGGGTTITASPNQIRRGARYFNASTDLVNVTSFPAIAMPLTLACWFNLTTLGVSASGTLFAINSSTSNSDWWRLVITNSAGSLEFGADQNSTSGSYLNKFINPPVLVANTWYQGACVFTSNSSRTLYLNGGNALGDVQVGATPLSINQVSMGLLQRNASPTNPFNGQVADCAVWNIALASGDIANLFAGARPNTISSSNLKGWWPLEANGATENDLSGNSNNGTVTGTTSWLGPPYTWRIG